ncbi:ROK family protein [Xylocopilactobacillus apis]|uniref:Glucokinase n=1 Tax=Xylocopilactobacillus apis TaxID=2932183 RepID=A0AAU9CNP1_9LACO|nr:ROK family protein [Xylocopilactobacillus apis]BDR55559.1 glucokinase [Xylocopilactobacillus apis]
MKSIGIDIGGTQLRVGIFDEDFKMIDSFKTENDKELSVKENLNKLIAYIQNHDYEYRSIGVGCPGPLNIRAGKILTPPNMPNWWNFDIVEYIESKTHLKTTLNNDANLAGLAEAKLGAGRLYKAVYYITMSTGIGGGYIREGEIVNGSNSAAGEIYNMIINEKSPAREGVNAGAVNEQCSGSGASRIAKTIYTKPIDCKELFDLRDTGDSKATEIIENYIIDGMAKCIANISTVCDPDVFVIGGSLAIFHPDLLQDIDRKTREYLIFPDNLRILPATFKDDAGLVGAALLP